jgi:hypothetical protein
MYLCVSAMECEEQWNRALLHLRTYSECISKGSKETILSHSWQAGFGLVTGFIGHFYSSWLHFTDHCHTDLGPQSCYLATASNGGWFSASGLTSLEGGDDLKPTSYSIGIDWYFFQLLAPRLNWIGFQLPTSNFSCQFLTGFWAVLGSPYMHLAQTA